MIPTCATVRDGATVRLTWLGHATVVLDVEGARLITDPLLRPHNRPLRRLGAQPNRDQWEGSDAGLISHLHHDHAEISSLRMLPGLPLLTMPRNAAFLRRRGLQGVGLDEGEWRGVGDGEVSVRLVRADHRSRPMPHRPNDACGHLVRSGTRRVWIAGDTSLYPEMEELPDLAGGPIELAVVPVGGWGARLSGGHLNPERAAQACAAVGASAAVPYHWGSLYLPGTQHRPVGWMQRPGEEFAAALRTHAPGCRAVVLEPGQSVGW